MEIDVVPAGEVTVVVPRGDLDMGVADRLRRTLVELVDHERTRIVLDLSGVAYLDSSGMGAIVAGLKGARARGGDLRLAGLQDDVRTVFELTRLDRAIAIAPTRQDAVASW